MHSDAPPCLPVNHVFVDFENVKELLKSGKLKIDEKGAVEYRV